MGGTRLQHTSHIMIWACLGNVLETTHDKGCQSKVATRSEGNLDWRRASEEANQFIPVIGNRYTHRDAGCSNVGTKGLDRLRGVSGRWWWGYGGKI